VEGRTIADGRKQRPLFEKHDTSSPAQSLEGYIASLVIDAMEERDIATIDVAGAFLKADMPDFVLLRLHGASLKAILRANKEKYEKFIVIEKGRQVLYVRLLKAMYGTLKAALLWYELLSDTLVKEGFTLNPYDPCVANKIVNGKQFTICWYVDDLKLSHKDPEEVTKMIKLLEKHFGEMNVERGSKHTFLGMNFEIKNKKVIMKMKDYLTKCIDSFGEVLSSNARTPANPSLMTVNEDAEKLNEEKQALFHHIVAKLLYICKRARLDLQVAVGFLCTRVKEPTIQDWQKLKRVLMYIRGTIDMPRIMSLKDFSTMDIYVDAAHAVHHDMRGQTGGCIQMGTGLIHARSSKQKLNTKSSTESEFVGSSDYLPYSLWMLYFFEAQGYSIKRKLFKQDNQSTMKLLKNGRRLAGKQSRHIETRFFWITDRIKQNDIEVEYCPTSVMLADFFTKPLQGSLFRNMRDVSQGLTEYATLRSLYDKGTPSEEEDREQIEDSNKTLEKKNVNENANVLPDNKFVMRREIDDKKERVGKDENRYKVKLINIDGNTGNEKNNDRSKKVRFKSTYADVVRDGFN